jgi:uncharacterized protein
MEKTRYHSYKLNKLAKGCQLCIKGKKSVFFITGICGESCFYCPISDQKYKKDVIYINEWPTRKWQEIKKEIALCQSKGVGITGGDPLARLKRTVNFIRKLKKEFGKNFHIHLYTPLTLVSNKSLQLLYSEGLDEIRFHPNLTSPDRKYWHKILDAKKFNWRVGVEIPVLPGRENTIIQLIDYIATKIDFLNLNELEYSDTNASKLAEKHFKTRNRLTYSIIGSRELALKLLRYIANKYPKMNVHFCTAKLKDKVQLQNRIKLRAKSIKLPVDKITSQGTLIRGAIYLTSLCPGKEYKKKLSALTVNKRRNMLKQLQDLKIVLKRECQITSLFIDKDKLRLLTSVKDVKFLASSIKPKLFRLAIIEEMPTFDSLELEVLFL